MVENSKYLAVESIRGVACFMVILSHLSLTFFPFLHAFTGKADPLYNPVQSFIHDSPIGFFFSGTSAVFIFFVLSGFILTKVALKGSDVPKKILSMSIKRYPRLMIPALASCILAYLAFQLFDITSPQLTDWIHEYGDFSFSLSGAIYSGLIDVFFLSGHSQYNPVLWTMKIELLGSIVIYILCLNRATLKVPCLMGGFFILTVMFIVFRWVDPILGLGVISFYGGYLFCLYGKNISVKFSVLLAVIGLYLAGAHNDSWSYSLIYGILGKHTYLICNFLSGFFLVFSIIFNDRFNHLFSGRVGVFMGKVSFSVYLIHMPIISTVGVFSFNILLQYFDSYVFSAILASLISIIVIYLGALIFYRAVDLQGMKLSNLLSKVVIARSLFFTRTTP